MRPLAFACPSPNFRVPATPRRVTCVVIHSTATAGLANPNHSFTLPPVGLVGEERVVRGSYMGSCVPARDIPRYIAMYRQGRLPVNKLMTGTLTLDQINEGFDRLDRGEAIRQVIAM